MISMIECSAKVEPKTTAQANNSDVSESTFQSALESGGEIPDQTKDKAHCFCPLLATKHGEKTAVILQGLGYKIAKSKKVHNGRRWHYDTLKALEKKWPYLTDSGIHGILDREAGNGAVFKDNFNEWGLDQTCWYSMRDDLVKRALEDEGKLWFDVPAAIRCHSIVAGTLYQNLRYHLLLLLADHPHHEGAPYHKVNKAALARILPWSLSTIKRGYADLLDNGLIGENPTRASEYTICNDADLILPETMRKHDLKAQHAFKSGSSTDKIGSSAEMAIVSSTELTGSIMEQIGSSTDETVSNLDDYTHYKPFEKHIHKHHSLTATPSVSGVCMNAADAADEADQDIDKEHSSTPVPGKEYGFGPLNLDTIRQRITTLLPSVIDYEQKELSQWAQSFARSFVNEDVTYGTWKWASTSAQPDEILPVIYDGVRKGIYEHATFVGWTSEETEVVFLSTLEIVIGVLATKHTDPPTMPKKLTHWLKEVDEIVRFQMPNFADRADVPPDAKTEMLIKDITNSNRHGWPTYTRGEVQFTVNASQGVKRASLVFFAENPDLSATQVWQTLADCVEVKMLNTPPGTFDPLFHARKGVRPEFLFRHYETIRSEIDEADVLAS